MAGKKIAIGNDHGAVDLKNFLKDKLIKAGYEVIDCGTYTKDSCHYPTYAFLTATKVATGEADYGVVCCRTGEGVSICANKVHGIRCGIGYNKEVSHLMKEHNNANMIAFGADYQTPDQAWESLQAFLSADFLGGRHQIRVDIITEYENQHFKY